VSRLRRFLHLERPRREPLDAPAHATEGRFGPAEGRASTPTPSTAPAEPRDRAPERDERARGSTPTPTPTATAGRFRAPEPRAPDTVVRAEGAQPFVRCFRCEVDNSVFARTCTGCGEELDTPAQRAFNEKLWAGRRREAAEEERLLAARAEQVRRDAEEVAKARREMGELLARETARRERDRLDAGGWGGGWGGGGWEEAPGARRPPILRLLSLIRDPRWRLAAGAALLLAVVLLVVLGLRARGGAFFFYVALAVVLALLSPGRRRWRRW
jgi:hypothetical protein